MKIPRWKRAMDIAGSFILILLLSPILLLTALAIKLESRGPVLYISKRAGQGYKVFDFYKFRSMRVQADELLGQFQKGNKYRHNVQQDMLPFAGSPHKMLVQDTGFVTEQAFLQQKLEKQAGTFVKIKNDPRVTRTGRFIRITSIDELPQLFNVLKGDMSLVGNRPIPLYEAQLLTSDEFAARFFAPAGITGLWQITKARPNQSTEAERKMLDIEYALHYNFWMDLRIMWKTLPATFQREHA